MNRYDDIIELPHHESNTHRRMPMYKRAAFFAPFAALTEHPTSTASKRSIPKQDRR